MVDMNEKDIIGAFQRIAEYKPGEDSVDRDLQKVRDMLTSQHARIAPERESIWRIIMKSKITKLAAAAAIIIAVIAGLYFPGGQVDFATPAFGQIIKNMQQVDWIYCFKEDLQEGHIREQFWASRNLGIMIGKEISGSTGLFDFRSKRQYMYNPQDRTVEISHLQVDFPFMYEQMLSSSLYMMDEIVEEYTKEEAYIITQEGTYNGQKALIYKFEIALSAGVAEVSTWVVDASTHLPIISEIHRVTSEGRVLQSYRYAFDYPKTGPTDIYDLGVPRDAEVIDKTPDEATLRVLETYKEHREKPLPKYTAIVKVHGRPELLEYHDGNRYHIQVYVLAINGRDWSDDRDMYLRQMGKTFDSTYSWLMKTDAMQCKYMYLHDGKSNYHIHAGEIRDGKPPRLERTGGVPSGNFSHLGWWPMPFEGKIAEDDYSRENGLICIEREGIKNYIDPDHGYMCVKRGHTVVEPAQTESGHWYPKSVGISGSKAHTTVLIDDTPDFPEGIFSPGSLPNYEKLQEQAEQTIVLRKPSPDAKEILAYEGFTPLHMAVFSGSVDSVRELLADGAEVNTTVNPGATPMELAALRGQVEIVRLLFEHGGRLTIVDEKSRSALAAAVEGKNLDVLKLMLENGADVNARYKRGKTALHCAAEKAMTEFVSLLLDHGADVEITDNHGETALLAGIERMRFIKAGRRDDCIKTVRLLLETGADVDAVGMDRRTALSLLCMEMSLSEHGNLNVDLVRLLAEKKADVNLNLPNETSLINAVKAKNLEVVKILLEAGADPFAEERSLWDGPIAVDIAAMNGCVEIEQLLRKYMEPKVSLDHKTIKSVVAKLLAAVRDGSDDAMRQIDLNCPYYKGQWKARLKSLADDYAGRFELFDEILSIRSQGGWAEVMIERPKKDREKYLSIILMQYPDDSWKVISWHDSNRSLDLKRLLQHPPASGLRRDLDDYKNAVFGVAEKNKE